MKFEQYEVQILSDGIPIPEYQIESDPESKTTACFIPSCSGKIFEIHWTSSLPDHTSVRTTIDGRLMGGGTHTKPLNKKFKKGFRYKPDQILPFAFSDLVLRDDDTLEISDASILENLGTIQVSVKRVSYHGHRPRTGTRKVPNSIGSIHEKSKKLGGHCVSFGKAVKNKHTLISICTPYPGEPCWATFIFKYRPKDLLQAQGIIDLPLATEVRSSLSETGRPTLKRSRSASAEVQGSSGQPLSGSHRTKRPKAEPQDHDDVIDLTMVAEEPPMLLDPTLRGSIIDLTLDD
ncbi:hypothetical protein QCA50_018927 [Cerrena zonata]|uniref:DUF7918 domain-containing protein n=1 Tax=Cerrena zonata TaxID=2478898 RepID=A0AAW0FF90_9APHY